MDKDELKRLVCRAIDNRKKEIFDIGDQILKNPELGYKEFKTAALVKEKLKELGLNFRDKLALTGVKCQIKGVKNYANICVIGELDAITTPQHPYADPNTGAAHACGHHAQIAAMLGVAYGLIDADATDFLGGDVFLFAVPAEECHADLEFKQKMMEKKEIEFLGGKQELIKRGEFDDIDMAMMCHALPDTPSCKVQAFDTFSGFVTKLTRFVGESAHASFPDKGVNALNAAMLALTAINAERETFLERDFVRVPSIISKGGDTVSVIPSDVRIESYVEARTLKAIKETNEKVNMAFRAATAMVDCKVEIKDLPGFMPFEPNEEMANTFAKNVEILVGKEVLTPRGHFIFSTDMGDVSQLMPTVHPMVGGFDGTAHSNDFRVADRKIAFLLPAKAMAMTIIDLLYDDANLARKIKEEPSKMTKGEYLATLRGFGTTYSS